MTWMIEVVLQAGLVEMAVHKVASSPHWYFDTRAHRPKFNPIARDSKYGLISETSSAVFTLFDVASKV